MIPLRILATALIHELFESFTHGAISALGEKVADSAWEWADKQLRHRKAPKKPNRRAGRRPRRHS